MDELFCCGTCVFLDEIKVPEGQKPPDDWTPRGYCYHDPPAVFPFPKQSQTLGALGQQRVTTIPMMMRPIVNKKERSCGKYTPNPEAMEAIRGMEEPEKDDNAKSCCPEGCTCG